MAKLRCNWSNLIFLAVVFNMMVLVQYSILTFYQMEYNTINPVPYVAKTGPAKKIERNPVKLDNKNNITGQIKRPRNPGESYIASIRLMSENISKSKNENVGLINGKLPAEMEEMQKQSLEDTGVFLMDPKQFNEMQNQLLKYQQAAVEGLAGNAKNRSDKSSNVTVLRSKTRHDGMLELENNTKLISVFYSNASVAKNKSEEEMEGIYFQKRKEVVNEFVYKYVIKPGSRTCSNGTFLVILVHSKPSYRERREAIRKTWGSVANAGKSRWPTNKEFDVQISLIFVTG